MRTLALVALGLLAACGDDSGAVDAGADLNVGDLATPADLKGADLRAANLSDLAGDDFAGVACGTSTCSGGDQCCFQSGTATGCAASCSDGGIPAGCDGPEDCSGGTPICCGSLDAPLTGSPSGQTACAASCTGVAIAMIGVGGSITSKICHNAADCVGYSGTAALMTRPFDICCHPNGATVGFCAPNTAAAFPGLTCN
jgi:hypothetical protein